MSRRVTTKETIKRRTIRDMKDMGIHKAQFNRIIDIYAGLVHQYLRATVEFEEGGYIYTEETASGNPKKSSIVSTMENLRKDILQYSDRLGLTPKAFESLQAEVQKESSGLAKILSQLDEDES